jgi:hypothetical protein
MSKYTHEEAKKRVRDIKDFYIHAMVYVTVNILLVVVYFLSLIGDKEIDLFFWPIFPMIGWGIGLAFHGLSTFVFDGDALKEWEEKKIQELTGEKEEKSKSKK